MINVVQMYYIKQLHMFKLSKINNILLDVNTFISVFIINKKI